MGISITEELYQSLLHEALELQNNPVTEVHDYQSFKAQIVRQELHDEVSALANLLQQGIDVFRQGFLDRCKFRAEQNAGTCLSLFVMPDGRCNQLYWRIAERLFEPKTMGSMLGILAPNITSLVSYEVDSDASQGSLRERTKNPVFHFEEGDLSPLDQSPTPVALGKLVANDNLLFDITNVVGFDFIIHEKFFNAFQEQCPKLAGVLYQHNEAFRTLQKNILAVSNKGRTPREVIEDFIRQLRLGGETLTGQEFASLQAQTAVTDFFCYLSTLPTPFKEELLLLKNDDDDSLDDICGDLREGECVETAAIDLKGILDYKDNAATLDSRPHLPPEELLKIQEQYGRSRSLSAVPDSSITTLPPRYLEKNLKKLVIEDSYDYLNLLLTFPPDYYTLLFKHIQILCEPPLPGELGTMIEERFFNNELTNLNQAIFINIKRLGGLSAGLKFAIDYNNFGLLQLILSSCPLEKRLKALQTLRTDDGESILEYAARIMPHKFSVILELLPPEHRLTAVLTKSPQSQGPYPVSLGIWNDPEALRTTLTLLPEKERFTFLRTTKMLGCVVFYPAILQIILPLLPQAVRLDAVSERVFNNGLNLMEKLNHNAFFQTILNLLPEIEAPTNDAYSSRKNEQILMLYGNIKQLKTRGLELYNQSNWDARIEGHKAICLALTLSNLANHFLNAQNANERNLAQTMFQMEWQLGMAQMQHVSWAPLLANIAIAATGLGLPLIIGKPYLTGSAFFTQTERHEKADEIANNFPAL